MKRLLTVLSALVMTLCLTFGTAACGGTGGNGGDKNDDHEHTYTVENKCSVCGKKWEYTQSDSFEYTQVVINDVIGYDVRFGKWTYYEQAADEWGMPIDGNEISVGQPFEGEEVIFPYGYNGLPVISIGRFYPCFSETVKNITVPKSIFSWGPDPTLGVSNDGVFACPALEHIDLPDGLPVSACPDLCSAFSADPPSDGEASLLSRRNLIYTGRYVLTECPLLGDPQFRENGALYIGNYLFDADFEEPADAFTVKDGTKVVLSGPNAKHVVLPDSVEIIAEDAFRDTRIESITVGSGIEEIGEFAFYGTDLTSISLPDKPISIGYSAFDRTPLLEENSNWEREGTVDYLYIGNHLIAVTTTDLSSENIFTMKEGLKSIAGSAFYSYMDFPFRFTEFRIPSVEAWLGVRRVRRRWSTNAPQVEKLIVGGQETTEIDLSSSFTEVPDYAVCWLSSLTHVTIPSSVTKIGECAFWGCTNLAQIDIPGSVTSIERNAFSNCYGLTSVTLGKGVKNIGRCAFFSSGLTTIVLPDSVTSIGAGAFCVCDQLTSITIPNSVTSFGYGTFASCRSLTNIQFKGTVAEWQAIRKGNRWDIESGDYTVTCTDGTVKKDGTVTYFEEE